MFFTGAYIEIITGLTYVAIANVMGTVNQNQAVVYLFFISKNQIIRSNAYRSIPNYLQDILSEYYSNAPSTGKTIHEINDLSLQS